MTYYGNNATPERIEWWESLPEREQNLHYASYCPNCGQRISV